MPHDRKGREPAMIFCQDHWNPEWYSQGSDFQCQVTKRILQGLDFTFGDRLLDIGCGDGRVTRDIAGTNPHLKVLGLDPSGGMILHAQEEHRNTPNLTFVNGDIQTYAPDEPFDFIVSFWALSWLTDHTEASLRIRAALKHGGRCFLLVPTNNPILFSTIANLQALPQWKSLLAGVPNPVNSASLDLYRPLFQDCGSVRQERFSCKFLDADALPRYLKGWLPHLKRLSGMQQREFLELFVADYNRSLAFAGETENSVSFDCVLVDGFGVEA